jgi:DNA-binding transcriptional MerR regulator
MGQAAVAIPEKMYFKIGEVCELVGVQAHVLRYWETEFPQLAPQKNRSGQRSYRRRDVEISLRIKELLYDEMYTIAGARKKLQSELKEPPKLKIVHPEPKPASEEPETPLLFENDVKLDPAPNEIILSEKQRQAIETIARNLYEIRELLSRNLE